MARVEIQEHSHLCHGGVRVANDFGNSPAMADPTYRGAQQRAIGGKLGKGVEMNREENLADGTLSATTLPEATSHRLSSPCNCLQTVRLFNPHVSETY